MAVGVASIEGAIGRIRGGGFKVTPQRLAVLEALSSEQHQSFDELHSRCPRIGIVTVYRTLDLFSRLGIARRLDLGDGPRYELAEHHHHHLLCESCGDISEFERCPIDPDIIAEMDFEVSSHSLEIYGRCANCRV